MNRSVSINRQRDLVTDGRSPREEQESTKELKGGNAGEQERRDEVGCTEGCTCRSVVEVCTKVEVTDGGVLGVLETETERGTLEPLWANQKPLPVLRWGREPPSS